MLGKTKPKSLKRPALNDLVRDYIKQYIFENQLNAGDALPPETQLVEQLGVGRSSVREAIKALQSLGIVEVRHGEGLFVREYNFDPVLETIGFAMRFNTTTLSELLQVRIYLESAIIDDVLVHMTTEEISKLESVMEVWKKRTEENEDFLDLDEEFHRVLYDTVMNQTLVKLLEVFWIAFENLDDQLVVSKEAPVADYERHMAILEAIKENDPQKVRAQLIQHYENLKNRIELGMNQS